ncbi:MAG: branched-chain amino acid ABC transporter permease [Candidatus Eremiobacteraeota bacterium]|nr:branched-chain amino acid ABC transporter permease [Candidatus Eremiobacteraeota bacterium]MBV8365338.1 branched-chain amino acid ABC transporter permease [Candidatus Eremiobacteraeota bacterium]
MATSALSAHRRSSWNGLVPLAAWAIVLVLLPWFMQHVLKSNVALATNMLIFGIAALGFNLLYGHTGELSFGHAAFIGLAGYFAAYQILNHGWTWWPALGLAFAATMLFAFILARVIVPRSTGIYFSMLMLAVGQVLLFIGERWNAVTGGDDGLQGIPRPTYILPGSPLNMNNELHFYVLVAVIAWLATLFMWRVVHSPFGAVCHAIRENKQRAEFLGYNVTRYKINAFVLSATLPAIAGVLLGYYDGAVNPGEMNWTESGDIVMMTLLGGAPTFWGPILGAGLFKFMQQYVSNYTQFWEGYIGIVFVGFVLFAPQGIWGLAEAWWRNMRAGRASKTAGAPEASAENAS